MSNTVVCGLLLYPVKSCRGWAVTEAAFDDRGLVQDRRLVVVDAAGRFMTQRDTPRLALVTVGLGADHLTLTPPLGAALRIPLPRPDAARCDIVVWHDRVSARDLGPEAARWLSEFLGCTARLMAPAEDFSRAVRATTARAGDEVAFQDGHPLLVVSEESLADLNHRLDFPVPMDRFRPNIIVRGCAPYEEDRWQRVRIGDMVLRASGPCARCVVTTTDQTTLERGKEPLRTLATYRRGSDGEVSFGQNYIHETKRGIIRVGDTVTILA